MNISREHIVRSNIVKYLGTFLNSTLSFHQHLLANLTRDTCQQLVQSLVMSHLDYVNAMLSGIPKTLMKIMQGTQNRAARITIGKSRITNDSPTEIRRSHHWLLIKERIDFKRATHIYKCQNNQAPMYLQNLITKKKIKHPGLCSSETKLLLEVPSTKRHTFAKRSFSVYGPKLWNTLPNSVKESKTTIHSKET